MYTDKFSASTITWDDLTLTWDEYIQSWDELGIGTLYINKFT